MTPDAVTTAPTKGTIVTDKAFWWKVGYFMFIRWDYKQSAGGTAGSGTYLFPIPSGYTIDTTYVYSDNTERTLGVVGPARSEAGSVYWTGSVHVWDSTNLYCSGGNEVTTPTYFSSSNTPLSTSDRAFSFFACVPILEWTGN
jgi:hypothetical protein